MVAQLRSIYGVDQPLIARYGRRLMAALAGDLGFSRLHAQPVIEVIAPAILSTTRLMLTSSLLSVAIAVMLGIAAALREGRYVDHAVGLLTFVGLLMPTFWLALLLILLFSVKLHWFPASGIGSDDGGPGHVLRHLVLPVATLVLATTGHFVRYVRAATLEAMRRDHIRTARAKGASETRVVLVHFLRPALIPVVTVVALSFGTLFSGALVIETMFAQTGMGKLIYDAVQSNDYNLALIGLLFATLVTLLSNFAAILSIVCLIQGSTHRSIALPSARGTAIASWGCLARLRGDRAGMLGATGLVLLALFSLLATPLANALNGCATY
jgi:peptide/nickel transport system permease protein